MRQILLGLIVIIALIVLFFGGSMPSSFDEIRSGKFQFEIKPMFSINRKFEGMKLGTGVNN